MVIVLEDGKQIRGDIIKSAILRFDLSPIPVTLEAEIRCGDENDDMAKRLAVDKKLSLATGDELRIIKSVRVDARAVQGERDLSGVKVTALLDACHKVSFVRPKALIKEQAALSAIYKATGATIKAVDADFPVPRFYCMAGDTPTFQIAKVLQEEGGVVRWKNKKLQFIRLPDLFKQKTVLDLPNTASDEFDSGFLERHEIPWFFSVAPSGGVIAGNKDKPRSARFAPFANAQRLKNMSRCLVRRKVCKTTFCGDLAAGDLVNVVGVGKLAIITAAHVYESGTDGGGSNAYTKLWLGSLEG